MEVRASSCSPSLWLAVGIGLLCPVGPAPDPVPRGPARRGVYPPDRTRIWVAPLITTVAIAGAMAISFYVVLRRQSPQQRLAKQMKRQSDMQVALGKEFGRPPAQSYLDLDARAATVRRLSEEARDVQSVVRGLDRKQYDRNEVAAITALDAMLTADLAYMDAYEQVVGQRKVQITAQGVGLPPAELDAMLQRQITVTTRAIAMIAPYVALKAISPAEGVRLRAQLQTTVAKLQAARAAHAPAKKKPKAKPKAA